MLEHVHQHIVAELQQSARTDTVFVVTAVAFDLIVLGINWAVADSAQSTWNPSVAAVWILPVLICATLLINYLTIRALLAGRQTRSRLLDGLIRMYQDSGVDKYYDPKLVDVYGSRYKIFAVVVAALGLVAITVPLLEFVLGS